jgi:hypothetical protein
MSKLLQRLNDASKSGVYSAPRAQDILEVTRDSELRVARVDLGDITDKEQLMRALSTALGFPGWFGANWDALEECLTDLSWTGAAGHVLLFEGSSRLPTEDHGIFMEVLRGAAADWAARGKPFFAIFPGTPPSLPPLYRD